MPPRSRKPSATGADRSATSTKPSRPPCGVGVDEADPAQEERSRVVVAGRVVLEADGEGGGAGCRGEKGEGAEPGAGTGGDQGGGRRRGSVGWTERMTTVSRVIDVRGWDGPEM